MLFEKIKLLLYFREHGLRLKVRLKELPETILVIV